jgi:hypothetical protein
MLVPVAVIGGLVLIYIGTYLLNKRTPIPEECREIVDKASCTSCHNFACSLKG